MSAAVVAAPLLQLRGVETFYGKIQALKGVDIDVNSGEIITLIGAVIVQSDSLQPWL
jgi:branched-chain amino acid transport system ATP-binding protein